MTHHVDMRCWDVFSGRCCGSLESFCEVEVCAWFAMYIVRWDSRRCSLFRFFLASVVLAVVYNRGREGSDGFDRFVLVSLL